LAVTTATRWEGLPVDSARERLTGGFQKDSECCNKTRS
jgi:hypothetical protein